MSGQYLYKPNEHICSVPNWHLGPNDERVMQSTNDEAGSIWRCDDCGSVWVVRIVVGSWRAYYKLSPRRARKLIGVLSPERNEE